MKFRRVASALTVVIDGDRFERGAQVPSLSFPLEVLADVRRIRHAILPPQDGFLFLDKDKFAESFASDVKPDLAAFMADAQVPWGVEALAGAITEPAWRTKPSWYLIATEDRMIPPDAQRFMSQRANAKVSETAASHSVYISQPEAVAAIIETTVKGVS